jgi:hypothetical protein
MQEHILCNPPECALVRQIGYDHRLGFNLCQPVNQLSYSGPGNTRRSEDENRECCLNDRDRTVKKIG